METNWSVGAEPFPQIVTDSGWWGTLGPGVVVEKMWSSSHLECATYLFVCFAILRSFFDNRMMHVATNLIKHEHLSPVLSEP